MRKLVQATTGRTLRIAVFAGDPRRQAHLAKLVVDAGHRFVAAEDVADAVLRRHRCAEDRQAPSDAWCPEHDQAGLLPHDADAAQIDAAELRSAARVFRSSSA